MNSEPRTIPPSDVIRMVFLGCGTITRKHAKRLENRKRDVRLAFASRDAAKAALYARELDGVKSYGSYEDALDDESVHVAFVATPTAQHLDLTLLALERGKDVIVEKPPFMQSADFDRVSAAMEKAGRRVFVAENYYYRPLTRTLRRLVAQDAIGDVRYLVVKALKQQRTEGWRNEEDVAGGGALFEGGIHWVNFMSSIGLTPSRVTGHRPGDGNGIERSMLAVFDYEEGGVGTLFHSWDTPSLLKGLRLSRIYGSDGSIAFESNGLFVAVFGRRPRLIFPGFRDIGGFGAMFADYFSAIRSGRDAQFTLARARRDLELVEAAYASAAST